MEKGYPAQELAPPYPGPSLGYGDVAPHPGFFPATAPPYPGPLVNYSDTAPQPAFFPATAPPYPGPPGNYSDTAPQPAFFPATAPPYPGPPWNYSDTAPQPAFFPATAPTYPGPPCNKSGFSPAAPPAGYQGVPAAPSPAAPVTIVTHVILPSVLRDVPGHSVCPYCQQTMITRTEHVPGLQTWAFCAGIALFGLWFFCCIPFCLDSCKDVKHRCSVCNKVVHLFKRM